MKEKNHQQIWYQVVNCPLYAKKTFSWLGVPGSYAGNIAFFMAQLSDGTVQ
jgi:hypothetical protein